MSTPKQLTFADLGLSEKALAAITKKGFEIPSDIQTKIIPLMLDSDQDIIAQSQTGTGKTAAFGLPIIDTLSSSSKYVQTIILAPTRELAVQVSEELASFSTGHSLNILPIYGGQSMSHQLRRLKSRVQIVVGTPGRVIDHIKRGTLDISHISHLILDEADEMLNMGFIEDIEFIIENTPDSKRTLLFSATLPHRIKTLAKKYMDNPISITSSTKNVVSSLTEQIYFEVRQNDKLELLTRIIDIEEDFYGLVFCRTKVDADTLASHLKDRGYEAEALHGDFKQSQREKILGQFKKKKVRILIATDVASRGIDVNNLTHVINHSLPQDPESYVHRIGRTGRAGNQGTAITFVTPSEYRKLMFIERVAKTKIKKSTIPSPEDIVAKKKERIKSDITEYPLEKIDPTILTFAEELTKEYDPKIVLAKFLSTMLKDELDPSLYTTIKQRSSHSSSRGIAEKGTSRLFVALGKKDNISPPKLVRFITDNTGIPSARIDGVEVYDKFSFLNVGFKDAEEILRAFKKRSGSRRSLVTKARAKR